MHKPYDNRGSPFTFSQHRGSASIALTPFPPGGHGGREAPCDGELPGGRMSVEVIVTLNRLAELTTGTNVTVGRRGFDVRSRVTINILKDSHDLASRSWRLLASRLGGVPMTRRRSDSTGPVVVTIPTAYKRLSDARATTGGPVGLGGGLADEAAGVSSGLSWTGTHRLQDRALGF